MQLDNITTPSAEQTPELRYASLHRAVERGMASDEVLRQLVEICLQLGHVDEALRVHATMNPGAARDLVTSRLIRKGVLDADSPPDEQPRSKSADSPVLKEHVIDAIQYLSQSYMPAVALMTMLAFPIIVGLGGFLTAGGSPWLFAALAAVPGICVLGVTGAMGRQIFIEAAAGQSTLSPMPSASEIVNLAKRYLVDFTLVFVILVAPSLMAIYFGMPLVSSLPCLLLGMFVFPSALILRQLRGDFRAIAPVPVMRAIFACHGYAGFAGTYWLAFAPAGFAMWASLGHATWLQISVVGPLAVLPTFATARLLGTFTNLHRDRLVPLLDSAVPVKTSARTTTTAYKAPPRAPHPRHTPLNKRNESAAPAKHSAPAARPVEKPAASRAFHSQLPPAMRMRVQPQTTKIEGRAPQRPAAPTQQAQRAAAPAQQTQRPTAPPTAKTRPVVAAVEPHKFGGPDLSGLPGAKLISASERERLGAASRKQ